jgi:uncharacterized protein YndB with AHSA1/START domain
MATTNTWLSRTTVRATPEHVLDTLTDPEACARWSPIPFSLDHSDRTRLRPGTTTHVCGRLLGAHVRFKLHTLAADPGRVQLHARGPIDIRVHYTLKPISTGCALDACVSIHPPQSRFGRALARAAALLLAGGTLDQAVNRIAHEAELDADTAASRAGGPEHADCDARHGQTHGSRIAPSAMTGSRRRARGG